MAAFERLWGGSVASAGVVLMNGTVDTGYKILSDGWLEGALGSVVHEPIMSSSVDQAPRKAGQREGSRVFSRKVVITGSSWADFVVKRDALVAEIRDANASNGAARLRVRSAQGGFPVEFVVHHIKPGPLTSHAAELSNRHTVDLEYTCSPYAYGDPMDVADGFDVDTLSAAGVFNNSGADWTVRSGTTPTITGGAMQLASGGTAATVEHTGTPYAIGDSQQTVEFQWTVQASGNLTGVVLKRLPDGSHLRVIVDDNGTNSTLRIQKVSNVGTPTDLGTVVNLGVRVPANTSRWVRGRIEGNVVTAEAFTAQPSPYIALGAAPTYYQHTLTAGDATAFGTGATGATGLRLAPASGTAKAMAWSRLAYAYYPELNPGTAGLAVSMSGPIPGSTSAEVDVRLFGGGGSVLCTVLGWTRRRTPGAAMVRPFGTIDAATATGVFTGGTQTADGAAHGGSVIPGTADLTITVDGSTLPDGPGDTVMVRVYARIRLLSSAATATMTARVQHLASGIVAGTLEFPTGRSVIGQKPASGTRYRLVNLGTLPLSRTAMSQQILISGTGSGAVADFALDYVALVPAASMAHIGVGEATQSPARFIGAGPTNAYRVGSNLGVRIDQPTATGAWAESGPASTFNGAQIRVPSGESIDWFAHTSTSPIDTTDPLTAPSQLATQTARAMQFAVRPRYWIGS